GAARVRAQPSRRQPRRDRHAGATAATARNQSPVPRVSRGTERAVVVGDAIGQLVEVSLAEQDRAGSQERLSNRRVASWTVVLQPLAAAGRRKRRRVDVVLERQRNAGQSALPPGRR